MRRYFALLIVAIVLPWRNTLVVSVFQRMSPEMLGRKAAKALQGAVLALALTGVGMTGFASDVVAADTVAVGACLLRSCKKELAQCVLNPKCLANVVCLNLCNGRPGEAECQIKCGDFFENDVVGTFNACAVSQKKCVPQKANEGLYPLPSPESTVKAFDTTMMQGRWYITAGLNKAFDTFDCQVHFFSSPSPGTILAKLNWRVTEPDGEFFTKNALQRFVQDPATLAHLANHDNEYLHYKDDWYVLDYEPDDFVLVYYMGSNDAWDGYGGAFLYSREPALRPELVPRLRAAVARTGLKYRWEDFTVTDNSCKPTAESPTILREKFARRLFITEEAQLQEQLTAVRNAAANSLFRVSTEPRDLAAAADTPASAAAREAQAQAREALRRSAEYLDREFADFRRELAREAAALEGEVERDLRQLEQAVIQK